MQYLNFGRKYKAAAATADISRLPGKNCLPTANQTIKFPPPIGRDSPVVMVMNSRFRVLMPLQTRRVEGVNSR
ncbi:hypothetical protein TNCV_2310161 [Trichonephila clavipes]|nr:hypothetical protein TNCV_2310161 [Trichonephila clavipes]